MKKMHKYFEFTMRIEGEEKHRIQNRIKMLGAFI